MTAPVHAMNDSLREDEGDLEAEQLAATRWVLEGRTRPEPAPDLIARLAEVVTRSPSVMAVEAADGDLTYAELAEKVVRAAQALRAHGVGPGSFVGISLPRGSRELVTMLATLTVGAAYVPLDLSHPPERLRLILEDALPSLWVREETPDAQDASGPPRWVFGGWDDLPALSPEERETPRGELLVAARASENPEALCYVLFTSGSTGRPKGVEIRRKALQSFLRSMADEPGLVRGQRLLAVSPTSFDISGLELYLPLWVGGTTVIADRQTVRDPRAWAKALEEKRIDCLQATPSGWRLLLDAGWPGRPGLKMLCGGEALTEGLAARLLQAGEELWNVYGPTETTVWSTLKKIDAATGITVGRPIDATAVAVLGDNGLPLPPGEEGEIVIGGIGLARGYRARPELTEAAFFRASWAAGARFYRTGDRGRLTPEGELVCLGRRDSQVKILGHRIELGEVEAALRATPGVAEVVVLAEHAQEKEARLVAYWQGPARAEILRASARDRLPSYMVPARYVSVASFPLNTNGKIDRRALAQTASTASAVRESSPARDWETCIAALWAEVLQRPHVGLDEDVFTLGATSLLAAELQDRLQALLGRHLPLAAVFEATTPRALARHVEAGVTGHESIVVRLRSGDPGATPVFCLLGVALYRELAQALPEGRDVFALHVPTVMRDGQPLDNPVATAAQQYVQAIKQVRPHGPYSLVGLCYGGLVAFEAARRLKEMGDEVENVVVLDAILPEAMTIDWVARLKAHARRAVDTPRAWTAQVLGAARKLVEAHPRWRRLVDRRPPSTTEMPVDGPDADRALEIFARDRRRLDVPVVIVRARESELAPWVTVAPDLGWSALAPRLTILDVETGHLDLLKHPAVERVARVC